MNRQKTEYKSDRIGVAVSNQRQPEHREGRTNRAILDDAPKTSKNIFGVIVQIEDELTELSEVYVVHKDAISSILLQETYGTCETSEYHQDGAESALTARLTVILDRLRSLKIEIRTTTAQVNL